VKTTCSAMRVIRDIAVARTRATAASQIIRVLNTSNESGKRGSWYNGGVWCDMASERNVTEVKKQYK